VIGNSAEECDIQARGMIEAGRAEKSDEFIFRIIVTPRLRANGSIDPVKASSWA